MLGLVKQGIPWDVANGLDPVERMAFLVILGSFEGQSFDWDTLQWKT